MGEGCVDRALTTFHEVEDVTIHKVEDVLRFRKAILDPPKLVQGLERLVTSDESYVTDAHFCGVLQENAAGTEEEK